MSVSLVLKTLAATCIVLFLLGCSKVPQEEVDAAKAALETAQAAQAGEFAPVQYAAAESTLDQAMAEIEKQNASSPLTRRYKNAKKALVDAKLLAEEAVTAATTAKEQMKVEVESILTAARNQLVQARELLSKAPKGKEGTAALTAIRDELTVVEATLGEATMAKDSGQYLEAKDKIRAAQQKIASIIAELNQAIAKKGGRR